jgi:hypothetical protein
MLVVDEFRVFYTEEGTHALRTLTDRNENGVPDSVEDVALQLTVSRTLLTDSLGFAHPLAQPRYQHAQSIDVFLLNLGNANGAAYDEVVDYGRGEDGEGQCALRIDLRVDSSNRNLSPVHELFHLYVYGYTMFKPRWFLEGTARWSEAALRRAPAPEQRLPSDRAALERNLLSRVYSAGVVWNRLGAILDPEGRIGLTPDLRAARYLDGSLVVEDDELHGAGLMKALLETLDRESAATAEEQGWARYAWQEADQRDPAQDARILRAIAITVQEKTPGDSTVTAELRNFLNSILP